MYFLGVDAGGTKTGFVLSDESGHVIARYTGGGGAFYNKGAEGLYSLVSEGVAAIRAKAGITDIAYAGFGFPGYGEGEGSERQITEACQKALPSSRIVCECDCHLGWAGSFGMEPGINIVAGTGSICYGVDALGNTARSSGWGAFCDEGSCRWLGERLVGIYAKQADGRIPRSVLYERFRAGLDIKDDMDFIHPLNVIYGANGTLTAGLQRLLKEIYDAGDPNATALYREAAGELWLAAEAVAKKLNMSNGFGVSYSGGLFKSGDCILKPLSEAVQSGGGKLIPPRFTPELGAVLMAMRLASPDRDFTDFMFLEA